MTTASRRQHVTFYCPDRHLTYDGRTPDDRGVGGGVTARLRLAAALARRGHAVDVVCNCAGPLLIDGVQFLPLDSVRSIQADILILHTTGDRLDLRPALTLDLDISSRRIVLVDGIEPPQGLHQVEMDQLYACSNFIAAIARAKWGVLPEQIVVTHHGVMKNWFARREPDDDRRNPFAIVYAAHPSKGLAHAIDVLSRLRLVDQRFELHVFGGNALWGGAGVETPRRPGVIDHGLIGQRDLARKLTESGFALYLQTREEPFGISVAEALAAGCITIASAVGAHPEIIEDGVTGFLMEGDAAADAVHARAVDLMRSLVANPEGTAAIRRQAKGTPLDWDTVAATWEQLWNGTDDDASVDDRRPRCVRCAARSMRFADGYRCRACGEYSRTIPELIPAP